jgi:uncharacterized membrane protein (DUF2068 family)
MRALYSRTGLVAARSSALLPWIVAFKAAKAALLTLLGVAVLLAQDRNPVEVAVRLAEAVHLPLSSRLFSRLYELAIRTTPAKEVAAALTAFGYAILMGTEGVGLYLRRSWARWFTIGATSSLMPIEVYEVAREPGIVRVVILLINAALVVYLWRRKEIFE